MVAGLEELTAACAKQSPRSESTRIAEGDPHWFAGYPVPATSGTVALAQGASLKLTFRIEDIVEVHRWEERFVIKVKSGAHMLVSLESVVKAGPSGKCCDAAKSDEPAGGAARIAVQDPPRDDWDVWLNHYWNGCLWNIECFTWNVPLLGPIRICIPTQWVC